METLISAEDLRNRNYSEADELEISQIMRLIKKTVRDNPNRECIVLNKMSVGSRETLLRLGYTVDRRALDHNFDEIWIVCWTK